MTGRVVVVTGARKGIGRYLISRYCERGWTVIGCSRQDIDDPPPGYRHYCLDVGDERAVIEMMREVVREHGRVDYLINNAAIAAMNPLLLTPLATVESIFSTNVHGTFLFCREAAKTMARARFGRIVNFSTVATPLRLEGEGAYAASKAAVESLTRIMARELGGYGVTVNAVGPTPVDTDLIRGVPRDKMAALIAMQAIKRMGTVEDVDNAVDFFLRDESDFITGQVVFLGGIG
jgi:3-oxoacyl-[acyl-carrier protein] reductase